MQPPFSLGFRRGIGTLHRRALAAALSSVVLLVCGMVADSQTRDEQARPGDCLACHGRTDPLPKDHAPTASMDAAACLACHAKGSPLTLVAKLPLGHLHQLHGITCNQCHPEGTPPGPLTTEQCLACHGSLEEVIARTATTRPHNPHGSPHGKTYLACDLCHHQHAWSENFCLLCHDFEYKVP